MDSLYNLHVIASLKDENYHSNAAKRKLVSLLNEKEECLTLTEQTKLHFCAKIGRGCTCMYSWVLALPFVNNSLKDDQTR